MTHISDGTPVVELDGEMDAPSDEGDCYSFVDSAGEKFWFRSADVALFAAPQHLIGTERSEEGDDEEDDEEDVDPIEPVSETPRSSR